MVRFVRVVRSNNVKRQHLVSLRDPGQQATNEEESTKEAQPKDFSLILRLQQRSVRFQFLRPHLLSSKALQQASHPDDGRRWPTVLLARIQVIQTNHRLCWVQEREREKISR